jgi:hypothetical protein
LLRRDAIVKVLAEQGDAAIFDIASSSSPQR